LINLKNLFEKFFHLWKLQQNHGQISLYFAVNSFIYSGTKLRLFEGTPSPTTQGCSKIYSALSLLCGSFTNIFRIRSFADSETLSQ
jgi:hypothetical protein